jgi:hypothetical protein
VGPGTADAGDQYTTRSSTVVSGSVLDAEMIVTARSKYAPLDSLVDDMTSATKKFVGVDSLKM